MAATDLPSFPGFVYEVPALITDWHDGDTCYATIAWQGLYEHDCPIRFLRLYCPEMDDNITKQPQPGAVEALVFAIQTLPVGTVVKLHTKPLGRAGRWNTSQRSLGRLLADILVPRGAAWFDYADAVVDAGHGWHTHVPGSGDGIHGIDHV